MGKLLWLQQRSRLLHASHLVVAAQQLLLHNRELQAQLFVP